MAALEGAAEGDRDGMTADRRNSAVITPVIQFGTSRFLQAHADLFISDARAAGGDAGPITVVQTTADPGRAGRLAAFDGRPIPIVVRGLVDGVPVERTEHTLSIARGLAAATDWPEIERIFVAEARYVLSNTGEAGYADGSEAIVAGTVPRSFPGKLTSLLHARWRAGADPLTLLPCELVTANGQVLRAACAAVALRSELPPPFRTWLERDCVWANSLVDRIVSAPLEPAGAVAEPYALWAIERQPRLQPPCRHPAIRMVDDLRVTERLKLFILNLGHTCLAERWLAERRPPRETVRECLSDPAMRAFLDEIYDREVLPVFAAAGIAEAPAYRQSVIERFLNPFLDHRLADIATHHAAKKARRIGGLRQLAAEALPGKELPVLTAIERSGVEAARS
jgi:tagaturonate reductase